jgi:hypothetical protein
MKALLIAFLLTVPLLASDLHEQSVHDAAHFGLGFAIQTAMYGFSTRGLRMRGWDAVIFSTVVTAVGTTMYEVVDTAPGMDVNTRGIAFNLLGAATSSLTTWTFRFNWDGE